MEQLNAGIWIGFLLQVAGRFAIRLTPDNPLIGLAVVILGVVIFVWGCMKLCEQKGYSKWLGLLGLLTCLGLLVILLLPERS